MRFFLFFIFVTLSFSKIIVYKGKDVNYSFPKAIDVKEFNSSSKEYVALFNYKDLPFILDKNLVVLSSFETLPTFLYSHKPLHQISTIGDSDFIGDIFFNSLNMKINKKDLNLKEFEAKKIDAILVHQKSFFKKVYEYDLSQLGFKFNKYYLVATKEYVKNHPDEVEFLGTLFPHSFNSALFLSSYYFGKDLNLHPIFLDHIKKYLSTKLKVITTTSWPPFNFIDNKEIVGIGIDFWKLIAKKANLDYEIIPKKAWIRILELIKNQKADVVPATSYTPEREDFAIFSKPYISFPFAIACRSNLDIKSIKEIKSLAVGYQYTAHKVLKKYYSNINFLPAQNIKEAFEMVKNNKAECVVDVLPTIIWMINKKYLGEIKVYFTTPFKLDFQIMMRKGLEDIRKKVNFAISNISYLEKQNIVLKYVGEKVVVHKPDYKIYVFIFVLMVVILILVYKFVIHKNNAKLDALTQILNRGSIEAVLEEVIKRKDGSIILLDIDFFKKINDNYGHEKGDFVLKEISKLIKNNLRDSDFFGRWGGEEFMIILPNTPYEKAKIVAEKIRKIVKSYNFDGINVTLSLGVASFKRGDKIKEVIKRADEFLYEAKNSGRNQVKGEK